MKQFLKIMFASALGVFVTVKLVSTAFIFMRIGIADTMKNTANPQNLFDRFISIPYKPFINRCQ
ncbi:hypothetical protein ACGE0T_16370 [Parabacteroides sp. APC149_11_2_Y6]